MNRNHMIKALVLAAGIGTAIGAMAQTTAASSVARDAHQESRIEHGLQNGSITTREGALLQKDEAHVDRLQAKDLKDGRLSPAERAQLTAAQNKSSRDIRTAERNGVNGNPLSASSQRMQADTQRNIDQQKRIAQGRRLVRRRRGLRAETWHVAWRASSRHSNALRAKAPHHEARTMKRLSISLRRHDCSIGRLQLQRTARGRVGPCHRTGRASGRGATGRRDDAAPRRPGGADGRTSALATGSSQNSRRTVPNQPYAGGKAAPRYRPGRQSTTATRYEARRASPRRRSTAPTGRRSRSRAGGSALGAAADARRVAAATAISRCALDGRLLGLARQLGLGAGPLGRAAPAAVPVGAAVLRAPARPRRVRRRLLVATGPALRAAALEPDHRPGRDRRGHRHRPPAGRAPRACSCRRRRGRAAASS